MPLSLRMLARHVSAPAPSSLSLRQMLARPVGPVRLSARTVSISVLTQNMGLLVFPGNYLGTDRDGAVAEICARIRGLVPDVVGLCEVFSDNERDKIRGALQDLYPHFQEGPDEADLESDGGLLLLSRHPFSAAGSLIYRDCDGPDCFANKGVIHVRTRSAAWPSAIDFFFTHAQDITTDDGTDTLYAQLSAFQDFIRRRSDSTLPAILMGDINIPANISQHYSQLLLRLSPVQDCWTILGNSVTSGPTYVRDNNFYEDADDRPAHDERLDYVLLRAGRRSIPIVSTTEVVKFTRNGRFISDHFGVRAGFDCFAMIDV